MSKPSWIKTTVGWEKKKIIWLRVMKGDTPMEIVRFIELNSGLEIYKDMPTDDGTIRKVIKELEVMPKSIASRLVNELPDMVDYFADKRSDLGIDRNHIPSVTHLT
jgi:hypothetical protein